MSHESDPPVPAIGLPRLVWVGTYGVTAAAELNTRLLSEYNAKNAEAIDVLVREHGVQLRKFSDDIAEHFGRATTEVVAEVREHSPLARRVDDSFTRARTTLARWSSLAEQEYLRQRTRALGL